MWFGIGVLLLFFGSVGVFFLVLRARGRWSPFSAMVGAPGLFLLFFGLLPGWTLFGRAFLCGLGLMLLAAGYVFRKEP